MCVCRWASRELRHFIKMLLFRNPRARRGSWHRVSSDLARIKQKTWMNELERNSGSREGGGKGGAKSDVDEWNFKNFPLNVAVVLGCGVKWWRRDCDERQLLAGRGWDNRAFEWLLNFSGSRLVTVFTWNRKVASQKPVTEPSSHSPRVSEQSINTYSGYIWAKDYSFSHGEHSIKGNRFWYAKKLNGQAAMGTLWEDLRRF